jgi:hypothetical protein
MHKNNWLRIILHNHRGSSFLEPSNRRKKPFIVVAATITTTIQHPPRFARGSTTSVGRPMIQMVEAIRTPPVHSSIAYSMSPKTIPRQTIFVFILLQRRRRQTTARTTGLIGEYVDWNRKSKHIRHKVNNDNKRKYRMTYAFWRSECRRRCGVRWVGQRIKILLRTPFKPARSVTVKPALSSSSHLRLLSGPEREGKAAKWLDHGLFWSVALPQKGLWERGASKAPNSSDDS